MNIGSARDSRVSTAAALVPATVAVMLGCWSLHSGVGPGSAAPAGQHADTVASEPLRAVNVVGVVLRVPEGSATIRLDDTPWARTLAAMLPLRLTLSDPMGQAKSGPLPHRIDVTGAPLVTNPTVGVVYYWPPSGQLAIFHDDLSQSVPPPGLVRLGVVDSGLDSVVQAGNGFRVRLDPADGAAAPGES